MGKPDLGVEHTVPRKGDIRDSLSDISKAKKVLGYSPRFSLEEGLPRVIEYFVAHS
jgi:nucleoside-diphosphate-sugar epimerase